MGTTSDLKNGLIIKYEGELYSVIEFQHVKMGRGSAFVRTKMRNLKTERVIERTFRSGEKIEDAEVERRQMQYLYQEADSLIFMDNNNYEQLTVPLDLLPDGLHFLKEGEKATIMLFQENPIGVELPNFVQLRVTSTEPGMKGDTVSGATKKAVLETGATILVPLFVEEGDNVRVDTRIAAYIERVK
jgi:elongation factor P